MKAIFGIVIVVKRARTRAHSLSKVVVLRFARGTLKKTRSYTRRHYSRADVKQYRKSARALVRYKN